jgi:uncharacterized membrane protein YeaQ/YmgE (transglycosylase-associated protein family)
MSVLAWIVLGFFAGLIARWVMPGRQPGGFIVTTVIGIVGAAIGGWIGTQLGWGSLSGFDIRSLCMAVVGAIVLLLVLSAIRGK